MDASDANNIQLRMQEIQSNASFSDALGKLLSGRAGYKPVIEKKKEVLMCKKCMTPFLIQKQKFCHECGAKNEDATR
jgi:protein-arginine kinase activator protein McsA